MSRVNLNLGACPWVAVDRKVTANITTNTLYVANQGSNTISGVRPSGSGGMGEGQLPGFFERKNGSGGYGFNTDDIGQSLLNR